MSQVEQFVRRVEALQEGDRSRLRQLAGRPLDETLAGFDLFTGLWWPLREASAAAPRRETSWLIAKLYGAFPIPFIREGSASIRLSLPHMLGRCEPRNDRDRGRYRDRFDALLQAPLPGLEPHLRWALRVAAEAVEDGRAKGLDWVRLLDDLSIWDRGVEHRRGTDVREEWAHQYLEAAQ